MYKSANVTGNLDLKDLCDDCRTSFNKWWNSGIYEEREGKEK